MLIKFLKHTGAARDGQSGDPDASLAIDYLRKRRLHHTCFQLAGLKFQGSRSSIFACGWPAATASRVALR